MCLREEENGTNWCQCCICVCEACLLHNLISHSYNSQSHAVISPGWHINKYIYDHSAPCTDNLLTYDLRIFKEILFGLEGTL